MCDCEPRPRKLSDGALRQRLYRGELISSAGAEKLLGIPSNRIRQAAFRGRIRPVGGQSHNRPLYNVADVRSLDRDTEAA